MRWLCSLPAAAALIAVAAPAGAATSVPAGIPHDVLAVAASARALPARAQFSTQLGPGLRTYLVPIPAGSSALDYSAQLRRRPGVVAAQPNTILTTAKISSPCAEAPTEQVRSIPAALNVGQNVRGPRP